MTITINNLPTYANEYKYIVARECDNEFWFYGAFDESDRANRAAKEVGGVVFTNK